MIVTETDVDATGTHAQIVCIDPLTGAVVTCPADRIGEDGIARDEGDEGDERVGFIPLLLAAIPLVVAGVGAGIAATTPGAGGGQPAGAVGTTFARNPAEESPWAPPSVEELTAVYRAQGADGPWVEVLGVPQPPAAYVQRIGALQWLTAYLASYGLPLYRTAAEVPAQVRAAWDAAQRQGISLAQVMGVATPGSAVPIGEMLAGYLLGGVRRAPASWSGPSSTDQTARDALAVLGTVAQAAATAYGGPAAGAAVNAGFGALSGAIAAGPAGAAPAALAGLAQAAAPLLQQLQAGGQGGAAGGAGAGQLTNPGAAGALLALSQVLGGMRR